MTFVQAVIPWLFVFNAIAYGAVGFVELLLPDRMQAVGSLWAAFGFALGAWSHF